jgi:hypothetical protein
MSANVYLLLFASSSASLLFLSFDDDSLDGIETVVMYLLISAHDCKRHSHKAWRIRTYGIMYAFAYIYIYIYIYYSLV